MSLPSFPHPRSLAARHRRRVRRGQLLVECLMALVLVAIASLMLVATSASMATLGDDALHIARAQREQGNVVGRALLAPCDTAQTSVVATRWPNTRLRVDEALSGVGTLHRGRADVRWTGSAMATVAKRELHVSSAGRCR